MKRKAQVLDALLEELRAKLEKTTRASRDAASYATDEQSRAESKWDTQGIEASFLAAGQANLARELASQIEQLMAQRESLLVPHTTVQVGALAHCELPHGPETFFVVPCAGGHTLQVEGAEVTTITPATPVGTALQGQAAGAAYSLPNGRPARLLRVE